VSPDLATSSDRLAVLSGSIVSHAAERTHQMRITMLPPRCRILSGGHPVASRQTISPWIGSVHPRYQDRLLRQSMFGSAAFQILTRSMPPQAEGEEGPTTAIRNKTA
jgi:hypothetical protein